MPTGLRSFRDPDCVPRTIRVGMRLDKYRVTSRLGSGGFATVYGAHDLIENR
ncbi:MAG: serine/threonine protein kinase, partial [Planctomycetota bacterium]